MDIPKKRLHEIIIIIGISLFGFCLNYIVNLLFAKHLSAHAYGDIFLILKVITICATLSIFGTDVTTIRFLPQYRANNKPEYSKGFMHWRLRIVTLLTLSLTILGALIATVFFILAQLNILNTAEVHPIVFSFWLIPLFVYNTLARKTLQATDLNIANMFYGKVLICIFEIIALWIYSYFVKRISLYEILFIIGITQLLVLAIEWVTVQKTLAKALKSVQKQKPNDDWFSYARVMFAKNVSINIGSTTVLIILEIIGSDQGEVGAFAAILTISGILYTINSAITTVFNPLISSHLKETAKLQHIVNHANLFNLISLLPFVIIILIWGERILGFFNPIFAQYNIELDIITIGSYFSYSMSMASSLITYAGNPKLEVVANVFAIAIACILSFSLIPGLQLYGAIWSKTITRFSYNLFNLIANKITGSIKALFII